MQWRIDSLKWEKNWENNVEYRSLDHKYKTIYKSKSLLKKHLNLKEIKRSSLMVEMWNWGEKKLRDSFSM
jgi:hypothetical protein